MSFINSRWWRSALAVIAASACGGSSPSFDDAGEGFVDTTRFVAACTAYNDACTATHGKDCGTCQYRIRFDRQQCSPSRPCANLVLLWAFMGCEGDQVRGLFDDILATHPGYVAACVQPLYPGELLPTSLGAPERDITVMTELFAALHDDPDTGVWTGENLLMTGCSAGASRYPVVAARYPDDARWLGSAKTAACFSDGVVSVSYQDEYVGEAIGTGGTSCAARHGRIASAYSAASPTAVHSCTASGGGPCACDPAHAPRIYPGDCGDGDCVGFDSIVESTPTGFALAGGVTPGSFAVTSWRLVSEGDGFRTTAQRCDRDVVPEAPFRGLCDAIDGDPNMSCSFVSLPESPHCGQYMQDLGAICVDWFESL
ncbi:MAG: hypothetical protein H6Q90_6180 [Deltaproteobacteria bacterium]|nr:hypothetical protein [Deltaproteobacteria bacterium]